MGFKALEAKIQEQAQKYYTNGTQDVTDAEFDNMVDALKTANPESKLLKTGWGYNVSEDTTPGKKVKHKYGEAGSLDKCRSFTEIRKSLQNCKLFASLKLDGLSVVLYYVNGHLSQALTRGDGTTGVDITDKIGKFFPAVELPDRTFTGAVRGEILMPLYNFEQFKQLHPEAKNARNSAVGLINANSSSEDLRFLEVIVYTVVGSEPHAVFNMGDKVSMANVVTWLQANFYKVAPYTTCVVCEDTCDEVFNKLKADWYGHYPADGIVITNPNLICNSTDNYIQYDAQAFKFESEIKSSEVLEVEWNMSKTHYAVPRVRINPIELAGTTVEFCTGYNAKYIQDNNICPGAIIQIEKKGEIIPNIVKVVIEGEACLPTHCPDCGHALEWNGVHLECKNISCGNAAKQDLLVWLDNLAPIDGLGDSIRIKFLESLYGDNLSIDYIMENPLESMQLGRSGHKLLISNMLQALYNNPIKLVSALNALNIPRLGDKTCEKLASCPEICKKVLSVCEDKILTNTANLNVYTDLFNCVGQATANSILDNLYKFKRLAYIESRIVWDTTSSTTTLKGKVAITGKLSVKRNQFEAELKSAGYSVGDISKDTNFLITDDPNGNSSKNQRAAQWGVVKISESDFRAKYM